MFFILFMAISFSIGLANVFISMKLYRKYRLQFLNYYLIFLIFSTAFGFIDIVCSRSIEQILKGKLVSDHISLTVVMILNLLAIPFLVVAWFYFIYMIRTLMGKTFSRSLKIGFLAIQTIITIFFAVLIIDFINRGGAEFSRFTSTTMSAFEFITDILMYLAVLQIFLYLKDLREKEMRRAVVKFGILYLFLLAVFNIRVHWLGHLENTLYFYSFLYFAIHLPPLLFMRNFLKTYYLFRPLKPENAAKVSESLKSHNISVREEEIIHLLLLGKSNKEIGQELFISPHTVRNHVFNIFQKLRVKNRLQLVNLIRNIQTSQNVKINGIKI
jgi:DNA-binding CsgD family transcriptional regulator